MMKDKPIAVTPNKMTSPTRRPMNHGRGRCTDSGMLMEEEFSSRGVGQAMKFCARKMGDPRPRSRLPLSSRRGPRH